MKWKYFLKMHAEEVFRIYYQRKNVLKHKCLVENQFFVDQVKRKM